MLKTKTKIKQWLNEMGIQQYTINKDLTVDVNGNVNLQSKGLIEIPIQFGFINGDFGIAYNKLDSLKGSPKKVTGYFDCCGNKLTSLEYCPKEIGGLFVFNENKIESFDYAPDSVERLACYNDDMKTLKGFKTEVKETFLHACQDIEYCIDEVKHLYVYNPITYYKYQIILSGQQLRAIQQEEALRQELLIKEPTSNKKLKL